MTCAPGGGRGKIAVARAQRTVKAIRGAIDMFN